MTVSTYIGFAFVSLMCFGLIVLPFRSPEMAWAIGAGIRTTISLEGRFSKVLNEFLAIRIGNLFIPTGLLLFLAFICFLVWIFFRTKSGLALRAGGINPRFAKASGIDVDKTRIIGTVVSTILGGIGIIVYSQSFTFLQLYQAPMYMGFIAAAAILIGGATLRFGTITHVILGTFLFQSILVVALPVANTVATLGSLAEISRIVVSNGVILYALAQKGGAE